MKEVTNVIIDWLSDNKEWVFSGIGVTIVVSIIGFVFKIFKKKSKGKSVQQNASFNFGSHITQVDGNINSNVKNYG